MNKTKVQWVARMDSIKREIARCILIERLIGHVLSPTENDAGMLRLRLIYISSIA